MKEEKTGSVLSTVLKVLAVLCAVAAAAAIALALVKKFSKKKKAVCEEEEDILDDACCGCLFDEEACDCSTCAEVECAAEIADAE